MTDYLKGALAVGSANDTPLTHDAVYFEYTEAALQTSYDISFTNSLPGSLSTSG